MNVFTTFLTVYAAMLLLQTTWAFMIRRRTEWATVHYKWHSFVTMAALSWLIAFVWAGW